MITNRDCNIEILQRGRVIHTISMSNYRMTIQINKSIYTSLNGKCEIVIQNLDQQVVNSLQEIYTGNNNNTNFKVNILYQNTNIVSSSLVNINSVYSTQDSTVYTTLFLYLGWEAYNNNIDKVYDKGTLVTDVIDDMIRETGLSPEVVGTDNGCLRRDRSLLKSITASGKPVNEIKKLLKKCIDDQTNTVYVEEDTVKVVPNTYSNNTIDIYPENCLEPAPQITDYGVSLRVPFEKFLSINCLDLVSLNFSKEYIQYQFENIETSRLNQERIDYEGEYQITDLSITIDNITSTLAICEIKAKKNV